MQVPCRPFRDETFVWTMFPDRYSHTPVQFTGWEDYVEAHLQWRTEAMEKSERPGIVHGRTTGRGNEHIQSACAIVLDCDSAESEPDLTPVANINFLYQSRRTAKGFKWHLVLPLSEPIVAAHEVITSRRKSAHNYFEQLFKASLDVATHRAHQILHPYTGDFDGSYPEMKWQSDKQALDLEAVLADFGYRDPTVRRKDQSGTEPQRSKYYEAVRAAVRVNGAPKSNGVPIVCPFLEEHSVPEQAWGDSSTLLLNAGYISCLHGHCLGRRQTEYLRALDIEIAPGDYPADAQLMLALSVTDHVTVREAQARIRQVLQTSRPYENTASVVRVSTGAGKTHEVSAFLNQYSAPVFDPETGDLLPGRSAVLALPTNALLREVEQRIVTDHRVRVGVLAVLNDDGTPACLKHRAASELQKRGGDVHRLMCAGCEFKEGCPAIAGATTGVGDLTITNHTLLPSVVRELRESGRVPLVVWDECPPLVESVTLKFADLDWLLEQFESEDRPSRVSIDDIGRVKVFGDRYRRCLRPLIEVLRRVRGSTIEAAVEEFGATRMCDSLLHAGESMVGRGTGTTIWERIRELASAAERLNVSDLMFDQMQEADQKSVLRAESIREVMEAVIDPNSVVKPGVGALEVTRVTATGLVWRHTGGVLLDATAPVTVLNRLRPDMTLTNVTVEDADEGVKRVLKETNGLSRTNVASGKGFSVVAGVCRDLKKELGLLERRLGRRPKAVVFTYRMLIPQLQETLGNDVAFWHYGNTRGYNHWFEEGFDAFITVGDPYTNIGVDQSIVSYLQLSEEDVESFSSENARAEAAQAHGRARDPQAKRGDGERLHLHYGKLPPLGWDETNTELERGIQH